MRQDLGGRPLAALDRVRRFLREVNRDLPNRLPELVQAPELPDWISPSALLDYFRVVNYDFDAAAAASLVLFAHHCRELGLIPAVPALRYAL